MKKILLLAAIFGAFALSSCGPEDTTGDINVSAKTPETVAVEGGTVDLEITSNTDWVIEKDADAEWFTLGKTEGSNNDIVSIEVEANTGELRNSKLIVKAKSDETKKKEVTLVQQGKVTPYLNADPVSVVYTATSVDITLRANVEWEATENVDWITNVAPSTGNGDATITLTLTPNNTEADRITMLTITGDGITKEVEVTHRAHSILDDMVGPYTCTLIKLERVSQTETTETPISYADVVDYAPASMAQEGIALVAVKALGFEGYPLCFGQFEDGSWAGGCAYKWDYNPQASDYLMFMGNAILTGKYEGNVITMPVIDITVQDGKIIFPETARFSQADADRMGVPEIANIDYDVHYAYFKRNKTGNEDIISYIEYFARKLVLTKDDGTFAPEMNGKKFRINLGNQNEPMRLIQRSDMSVVRR